MTADSPSSDSDNSSKEKLTRAAGSVGLATLISRLFGFVRDMIIADLFGARAAADAFFVAFRIPNLLRRFTAEGAMTAAFIPVYSEVMEKKGRQGAFPIICNILTILTAILIVITAGGIIFAPWIVKIIAPGFTHNQHTYELTTLLTQIMFPYLLFISLAAMFMAALNSMGRFFIPAISPALLNIAIIGSALFLYDKLDEPVMALAIGVLIGGALQLAVQIPSLSRMGFRYVPSFDLKDVATRKIAVLMVPAAFGMAVAEINVFVDTVLASLLPEGSVSYLFYGNRLVQFPLGVFGVAVGIAALPTMSAEVAKGNKDKLTGLLSHSLRLILFVSVPSTIGLILLANPIINTLFERGQFDETARAGAAFALIMYAVGLVAFAGVKVTVSAFYSLQDTSTPTRVAAWCMALNVALNLLLMGPLQHGGLALATSIASMVNILALLWFLRKRLESIEGYRIVKSGAAMLVASVIMGGAVYGYTERFYAYNDILTTRAFHLFAAIGIGVIVYMVCMLLFGSKEALSVKNRVAGKMGIGG
jgi:putative peptidoglycan lipid II flippase